VATSAKPRSARFVKVTSYEGLIDRINIFRKSSMSLLILVGGPGLGKTSIVAKALGKKNICLIEGHATAFALYETLYRNKDKYLVIDDVDGLYADRNCVRVLKMICQSTEVKSVSWHSQLSKLKREGLPAQFTTKSRVVIISNDWRTLNKNIASLEDRGQVYDFEPSPQEVHKEVGKWFKDQVVYEWFADRLDQISKPSFRHYIRAADIRQGDPEGKVDFAEALEGLEKPDLEKVFHNLMSDDRFASMKDRERYFIAKGFGSKATFWRYRKRHKELYGD
jgi:hypothetical protein